MLVLDTRSVAAKDRAEAFQLAVSGNCTESVATFEDPRNHIAKLEFFDLGPATVFNIDAGGTTLKRTPRLARAMDECIICLALPIRTDNRLSWDREDRVFGSRDLMLVDLSAPYVYEWRGVGASYAFQVDFAQLGLPMDMIHAASREIRASPIYSLVRDHIWQVMTQAQKLVDSGMADQVAPASIELMRALIVSAVNDAPQAADLRQSSLLPRVQAYVRAHIRDPELTPARIAGSVHISIRALYKLYEPLGLSLEQTIIEQRLIGAKRDLASPGHAHRSIAAIAASWGFTRASYFSNRFHLEFGLTPGQWRTQSGQPFDPRTDEEPRTPHAVPSLDRTVAATGKSPEFRVRTPRS